jgi:undecaprenyl-diphosphatase
MRRAFEQVMRWVGSHEAVVLVGLFVPVAGAWAFLALADEVMEGGTQRLDDRILLALRHPDDPARPIGPAWLEDVARDITSLGGVAVIVLITAVVAGFLLLDRKYAATVFVLAATGSGFALGALLKGAYRRPRPEVVPHLMAAYHSSFPSGHSMMSAVVYLTLGALVARLVARRSLRLYVLGVAATLTGMVGASRVYLGVHYPSDVLAGWCAGLVWASLCWLVERRLQKGGAIERAGSPDDPEVRSP